MTPKEVASKIKAERKRQKLTQQEVADKIGVSRRFYARYESGLVNHSVKILDKIAIALNCDLKIDLEPKP